MKAMNRFLDDYVEGREQGRYVAAEVPHCHPTTIRSTWRSARISCFSLHRPLSAIEEPAH
jgi:hypothetical protein